MAIDPPARASFLFITLDSCRYDTFVDAATPHLDRVGPVHRAAAPSNFTFGSHAAMFVGFTPGVAEAVQPFVNPKFGKVFKMIASGFEGHGQEFIALTGENIVQGYNRLGFVTIGSGAVGWFNPATETGRVLGRDFQRFHYAGDTFSLDEQLAWLDRQMADCGDRPAFVFLNVGETHVPYYYRGAPWRADDNPCVPFSAHNDAAACRDRQRRCLEHVDGRLAPLLDRFADASILVCADHGDCWGEDGLWEHGIHHEQVLTVPLVLRLAGAPVVCEVARPTRQAAAGG